MKKNVERCPTCGSTKAHYDPTRSRDHKTFMTCPVCKTGGLLERWEVARDWFVDLELDEDAPVPESLPPQTAEERAAADARARWLVMAHDSYAREDRVVAQCTSEGDAQRRMEELQAAPNADHMWIERGEP